MYGIFPSIMYIMYDRYCPEKNFPEGIVLHCVCFFMFASALSLVRLDGSQPNFDTRWRGGLAPTLLKMGIVGLTVWQPSWKSTVFLLRTV